MKTCSLHDFMTEMKPWLDSSYIQTAFVDKRGNFVLQFIDGVQNIYNIDDCNAEQIQGILKDLKARGISILDG
ncbi:MAG: hypothetical protein D6B25_02495 [Desulfobulbaceae bacterium]|nr:MAG: hypothetical protein D6B25_02495 [Desulfobulbaceae bacterium]